MIKYYKSVNGSIKELRKPKPRCWIDVFSPNEKELAELSKLVKIPVSEFKMALDEDERPRIDIGKNFTLFILRLPFVQKENEIETSPIGIFLTKNYTITVHLYYTGYVKPIFEPSKNMPIENKTEFILYILSQTIKSYFQVLGKIEKQIDMIEDEVVKNPRNIIIEKMADIKRTLIFFYRSLIANRVVVLSMIEKNILFIDKKRVEDMKDIHTEIFQLLDMTITYRDLLKGSMDSYSSIVSNKVGETVKILTVITAILTIPLLITGFWGMNISLPFGSDPNAFTFLVVLLLASMIGTLSIFKLKNWL
ncbi:MAG: magnesium transporter CorA family protein [Candidatus Aenigmarchaeota archaeon]|nr:magnesium transporter CorA family protein [Candidatus Aenigmarchaeota archaeon]